MVVRDDQHERKFFHCGLVERFVKCAGGSRAIAEASNTDDSANAFHASREQHAVHDRNHCTEMADHGEITFLWATAMHVAVASAHRAER